MPGMSLIKGFQEKFTKFITIISSDHNYIHQGISFSVSKELGTLAAAYHIALTTPATGYVHYRPFATRITTDANAIAWTLKEDITSFTGGSAYTPFNRNRENAGTSTVVVTTGVTPTLGTPTLIDCDLAGTAGNPVSAGGGVSGGGAEIILKQDTIYLFSITPAGSTNIDFNAFWYEETQG